jgi:hypothetical protein
MPSFQDCLLPSIPSTERLSDPDCLAYINSNQQHTNNKLFGIMPRNSVEHELDFGKEGVTARGRWYCSVRRSSGQGHLKMQWRTKTGKLRAESEPRKTGLVAEAWTNNNCESMNHILQIAVEWRPQSLVDLVTKLYGVVQSMYKDLRKALFGRGIYQLAVEYLKYST